MASSGKADFAMPESVQAMKSATSSLMSRCGGFYRNRVNGGGDSNKPRVILSNGCSVIGRARETTAAFGAGEFVSFTKIPYAKPPIGNLRFRRPVPAEPWHGALKATKKCPKPLQINKFLGNRVIGQEDCLYLNVYTPDLPITENQHKLAVIVWLSGDDFCMGDASEDFLYPEPLMSAGQVVVVTVSYRLGPFGFLCLGNDDAPGNQALWDQKLALQWVQENISVFGGDPDRVTLVGEGSGAVCATYHMLSGQSAGLFHGAICMSGSLGSAALAQPKKPEVLGKAFVNRVVGRDSNRRKGDKNALLNLMLEKRALDIVRETTFLRDWDPFTPQAWLPVVDGKFDMVKEHFLVDDPISLIKKGAFNKMPVIFGATRDEGLYYASSFLRRPSLWSRLDSNWTLLLPMLLLNLPADEFDEDVDGDLAEKIKEFYLDDEEDRDDLFSSQENTYRAVQMFGDAFCLSGIEFLCKLIKDSSAQPVYLYSFEHQGRDLTLGQLLAESNKSKILKLLKGAVGVKARKKGPYNT